jgi:hypothetical protein
MRDRQTPNVRKPLLFAALLTLGLVGLTLSTQTAWSDDRDLLRFKGGNPYLFFLMDTSASMTTEIGAGNNWVPGGADNPSSRMYQAKQAIYNVFRDVDDVHFGFAGYNQDNMRVIAKRFIYFPDAAPGATWPLDFPQPELDGQLTTLIQTPQSDTDGDGDIDIDDLDPATDPFDTRVDDTQGDVLTFGTHLCSTAVPVGGVSPESVAAPRVDCATEFPNEGVSIWTILSTAARCRTSPSPATLVSG